MRRGILVVVSLALFLGTSVEKGCLQKQGSQPRATTQSGEGVPGPIARQHEVERVIESLRVALEGHSLRSFMEAVDPVMFDDYAGFEERLERLLQETGELRVYFRAASVQVRTALKDTPARAQAQVDAEMIFAPKDKPGESQRRQTKLTMSFEDSAKGWRLTKLQPREFFSL